MNQEHVAEFILQKAVLLDELAEQHDALGTLRGLVFRNVPGGLTPPAEVEVELVFDHALVQYAVPWVPPADGPRHRLQTIVPIFDLETSRVSAPIEPAAPIGRSEPR